MGLVFYNVFIKNNLQNIGYIRIYLNRSILKTTSLSFSIILNSLIFIKSNLSLSHFILIFFYVIQTIFPFLRSSPSDLFLFSLITIFYSISLSFYQSIFQSFISFLTVTFIYSIINLFPISYYLISRLNLQFIQNNKTSIIIIILLKIN